MKKMIGNPQKTKTLGHDTTINEVAMLAAKEDKVKFVAMDQGINKIFSTLLKPNQRPDIIILLDKHVTLIEVVSRSQDSLKLQGKLETMRNLIKKERPDLQSINTKVMNPGQKIDINELLKKEL